MAVPGVIATLTFAPLVLQLFYSAKFAPAVEILRWICLGMVLRVASWPMGFILLAKGARAAFFWSELFSNLLFIGLIWAGLKLFGLTGTGIAFFSMYAAYWLIIYLIVRRVSEFRWSAANRRLALVFLPVVTLAFVGRYFLPGPLAVAVGTVLTLAVGIYSLKILCTLVPLERFPAPLRKMILFFGLAGQDVQGNHPV
jgi:enterobacterial common antigen flippase